MIATYNMIYDQREKMNMAVDARIKSESNLRKIEAQIKALEEKRTEATQEVFDAQAAEKNEYNHYTAVVRSYEDNEHIPGTEEPKDNCAGGMAT